MDGDPFIYLCVIFNFRIYTHPTYKPAVSLLKEGFREYHSWHEKANQLNNSCPSSSTDLSKD